MSFNPPLRDWNGKSVWIVGASTGIGRATAQALHEAGATVYVSARSVPLLNALAAQHPRMVAVPLDVTASESISIAMRAVLAQGPLDAMLYCAGHYQDVRATDFDLPQMLRHQQVNYVGVLHVLDEVIPHFLERGAGHISLTGSVAGYRGLPKSLAYGPTKAALINLAEGLYGDLHPLGIGVSIVNPGFVETPLTAKNAFHMPALMSPDAAAVEILKGWARGEFEIHFPRRFTRWMKLLRLLPHAAYFPAVRRFTGL